MGKVNTSATSPRLPLRVCYVLPLVLYPTTSAPYCLYTSTSSLPRLYLCSDGQHAVGLVVRVEARAYMVKGGEKGGSEGGWLTHPRPRLGAQWASLFLGVPSCPEPSGAP